MPQTLNTRVAKLEGRTLAGEAPFKLFIGDPSPDDLAIAEQRGVPFFVMPDNGRGLGQQRGPTAPPLALPQAPAG